MDLELFECKNLRGRLTKRACGINQEIAVIAIESILDEPSVVYSLGEPEILRMLACGRCEVSDIDRERAVQAHHDIFKLLEEQLDRTLEIVEGPNHDRFSQ